MYEAEIALTLDKIWNQSSARNLIPARLGRGATGEEIEVPGRPGYVYVRLGEEGDGGVTWAKDMVGVALVGLQRVELRRELGELVIRQAAAKAGGNGGGGSDTLAGLSDVQLTSPASGHALQYNGSISKWVNVVPAGGGGGAPSPHDHESSHHTPGSLLNWTTVSKSGSSLAHLASRNHGDLQGINPDQHHPQVHPLVGPDHTASGLTPGLTVRATSATTFDWAQLWHTDLDPATVLPDQHHFRVHDIISGDEGGPVHTVTGAPFDVVGAVGVNVLGLLTPTHNPGAAEKLLKTSPNGSLFLDTNLLYVDALANAVSINRTTAIAPESGAALDVVIGSNLNHHTQRIKQKEGQLGRMWRIENTEGDELIVLDSVGNLQSGRPGYVSGMTGWQVTPGGNAEFNNIWARGELHATVFVKDEIHASGGTILVSTAGKLHADAIIDASTVDIDDLDVQSAALGYPGIASVPLTMATTSPRFLGTTLQVEGIGNIIEIDDPPSGPGLYFQPGEILRVKTEINEEGNPLRLSDLWLEVLAGHQGDGFSSYSVTKRAGADCTIPAGTAVVTYKKRGEGLIMLTSDWRADEGYTPYIDVFTTGQNPWDEEDPTSIVPHVRLGQLKGVGLPGVSGISQYGLIAGTDLTDANSGYLLATNLGLSLYKGNIRLNNGNADTGLWTADGHFKLGRDVSQNITTGLRFDPISGDVWIGKTEPGSQNYLHWDQEAGTLYIIGSLSIASGGTGYVTHADMVDADKANLAASKKYSDDRRILKVTGGWDSPANNLIAWGLQSGSVVEIFFWDGTKKAVADGGTWPPMLRRTYLYADLSQVAAPAALTLIQSTTEFINNPNLVLIAVCDPGPVKASVSVVAGGTYISGGNIFTNSIRADNIVANTITANEMNASFFTVMNNQYILPAADDAADLAEGNAKSYGERRRIIAVMGDFYPGAVNTNTIGWRAPLAPAGYPLAIRFADGSYQPITPGSMTLGTAPCTYLTIDADQITGNLTIGAYTNISLIPVNRVIVAVVEPYVHTSSGGAGYPTIRVIAGATYIAGDTIITGSIVARNIRSGAIITDKLDALAVTAAKIDTGAVTADKINVANLQAVNTNTGALSVTGVLTMGPTGRINSAGRTTATSEVAGFFLGHEANVYRFSVGNADNYIYWDGLNLHIRTQTALTLKADSAHRLLHFIDYTGAADIFLTFQIEPSGRRVYDLPMDTRVFKLEANSIHFYDTFSAAPRDIVTFNFAGYTDAINYDPPSGNLSYSRGLNVASLTARDYLTVSGNTLRLAVSRTPTSGGAGTTGEICWDGQFIYVCVAANTWRKAQLVPV